VLLDEKLGYANVERLVAYAASHGNFIRIDMEDSPLVDVTLRIYKRLRKAVTTTWAPSSSPTLPKREGPQVAPPTEAQPENRQGRLQGAPDVAYPKKADVDAAYRRLVELSIAKGGFTPSPRTTRS